MTDQDSGRPGPSPEWTQFIASIDLFSSLDTRQCAALAEQLTHIEVFAGSTLLKKGDLSERMYLLLSGKLEESVGTCSPSRNPAPTILEPGSCIDANALILGERRTGSLVAIEDSQLLSLDWPHLNRLRQRHPTITKRVMPAIIERLQRQEVHDILHVSHLFRDMSRAALEALEHELQLVTCSSGETLITQDEYGDCGYIIISGRLRISYNHSTEGEQLLCELSRGQSVGEISVITSQSRTASVKATRDSLLARLSKDSFDRLLRNHPHDMMKQFAGKIITALQEQTVGQHRPACTTLNIAIFSTDPSADMTDYIAALANSLNKLGKTLHLSSSLLDDHLSPAGIAQTPLNHANSINVARWLNHQESNYAFIIYQADAGRSAWSERCLHQADRIILMAHGHANAQPGALETDLLGNRKFQHLKQVLVLLHPSPPAGYSRTRQWLANRTIHRHYHLNTSDPNDYDRVTRLLTGNGIGLVVSGGGARGFAHIGGIKAMRDAGIAIDKIGGTSMGSIVAAMQAMGWDYEHMLKQAAEFNYRLDYTVPFVSLTTGSNFTNGLKKHFGDQRIEDLHLGFYCVSTDLNSASQKIHDRGLLWKCVRASASIPGLFPPVIKSGAFLVDGALTNNMPADIMARSDDIGYVIAFDVGNAANMETDVEIDGSLSGWSVIANWLNPFKRPKSLPKLTKTLIQSSTTKNDESTELMRQLTDFYVLFPVQHFGLVEFNKVRRIVESGYQHAIAKMAQLRQELSLRRRSL